jgi:hypothetical protein
MKIAILYLFGFVIACVFSWLLVHLVLKPEPEPSDEWKRKQQSHIEHEASVFADKLTHFFDIEIKEEGHSNE